MPWNFLGVWMGATGNRNNFSSFETFWGRRAHLLVFNRWLQNRPMGAHTESDLSCTSSCVCGGLSCQKNLLSALPSRIARVDPSQVRLRPKQPLGNRMRRPRQKPWPLRARKPMLRLGGMKNQGLQSGLRNELSLFGEEPFF